MSRYMDPDLSPLIESSRRVSVRTRSLPCDTELTKFSRLSFEQCGVSHLRRVVEIPIHRFMDNVSPEHVDIVLTPSNESKCYVRLGPL